MEEHYVDLNCDLGESFGAYTNLMETDKLVLPYITSANVACGFHASDPVTMKKTVEKVLENKVNLGAHPGLPDLLGFGRRNMKITAEEAEAYVVYQVGALQGFAHSYGAELHHVKPHGALYNMAANDLSLAEGICRGIKSCGENLILIALYGSCHVEAAEEIGIPYMCEVFADRAYTDEGRLVPRSELGAVITNEKEVAERTVGMIKEGKVKSISGKDIQIKADTVCVHGDNPKAIIFLKYLNQKFLSEGIKLKHN